MSKLSTRGQVIEAMRRAPHGISYKEMCKITVHDVLETRTSDLLVSEFEHCSLFAKHLICAVPVE